MEKKTFERPLIKKLQTGMPNKFGMKTEYEPITEIDNVPVKELIEKYGSPLYVISENTIRETYRDAYRAFSTRYPKVQFAWSYKTNYLNAVCRVFHQEGSWAEVVSGYEFEKALGNGIQGKNIIFNGPDKSRDDLMMAVEKGAYIHIDHFDELFMLHDIADHSKKKPKVAIRVNMDAGIYPQWTRFGFNYESGEAWEALNRIMLAKKLDLVGLHCHIGTYIMTPVAYATAASKLADLAVGLANKYKHHISYIDMGGGFASKNTLKGAYLPGTDTCPSFDAYAESITSALISSAISPEQMPMLILETGRALIDDAGSLLGTVIANKRIADGKHATVVDVGVNLLFTSFWYDNKITPAQPFGFHTEDMIIYGPLCMNIDVLREYISLPPMKKGDHFVISRIGAYNMTQWMQFINYRPKIVMIDQKQKVHLVRDSEDLAYLNQLELVPEHLNDIKSK